MEQLRYNLVNGRVEGIGFVNSFNTLADGTEPFFLKWEDAHFWEYINGSWQLIKPDPSQRMKVIELDMPDRAGYQRKLFVEELPTDLKAGKVIVKCVIEHYLNGVWQYDNNIQDKYLELVADNTTLIQTANGPVPEFDYLVQVFSNPVIYFSVVQAEVQNRINDGTVDSKLIY